MKINVRSYQRGGGLKAAIYQPVTVTPTSTTAQYAINLLNGSGSTAATKSSGSDGKITEKDLYTGLYKTIAEQGLQSDTAAIIQSLQTELFNDSLLDPFGDTSDLSNKYLKALSYVNMAKGNQKEYDEAYQLAVSKDSLQENAVTTDGKLVVKTQDGEITTITPEEYRKNQNRYQALTNGNLLAERNMNPKYAFQNGLLQTVKNGTSSKEIYATINTAIQGLGNSSNDVYGYTSVQQQQIQKGISLIQTAALKYGPQAVLDMVSTDGLYKVGIKDKNQQNQVQLALDSLFQMLSPAQQTLLKVKSPNGTNKGAYGLLAQIIGSHASSTFEFNPDLESGVDANGNKVGKSAASGEDKGDNTTASFITNVQKSMGGNEATYVVNPGGTAELSVTGTHYGVLQTPDGKAVGKTSLQNMLQETMLQGVTDVRAIYFGDQQVSSDHLKDITYENEGATKVLLPAVKSGSLWRPNFEYFDEYEKAAQAVRAQGLNPNDTDNPEAMKALAKELEKLKLYDLIDRTTGLPNTQLVRPFLVTTGYASTKAGIKDSKYLTKIDDSNVAESMIETLSEKGLDGKVRKYDLDADSWWPGDWFGLHDEIYKGTIYIPINTNELAGATASGQKIKSPYAYAREQEYQQSWKRINSGTSSSSVLQ